MMPTAKPGESGRLYLANMPIDFRRKASAVVSSHETFADENNETYQLTGQERSGPYKIPIVLPWLVVN